MTLLLALLWQSLATVGDTVWIDRAFPAAGSAVVRPQAWSLGDLGQQLGPAEVRREAPGPVVRYALVFWYPGEHQLTMPGPVIVKRDGSSDTLAAVTVRVSVASVLPEGARRTALPPKPPRAPMALAERSLLPLAVLLLVVLLAVGVVALLWRRPRRTGKPNPPVRAPRQDPAQAFHDPERLRQWADAGEYRAALDGWGWLLARRMAETTNLADTAELQKVLDDIADSVFSTRGSEYFEALCRRAEAVAAP